MLETELRAPSKAELWIPESEIVSTVQEVGPRILTALQEEYPERILADRFPVCGPASLTLGHYLSEAFTIPIQQYEDPEYAGPWIEFTIRDHHFLEENRVIDQTSIMFHTGKSYNLHINAVFPSSSDFIDPFHIERGSKCRANFERQIQRQYDLYQYSPDVSPLEDGRIFFSSSSAEEVADAIWAEHQPVIFSDEGFVGPSGIYRETPSLWGSRLVRVMQQVVGPQWQPSDK